jgi:hypothetical protein
MKKYIYIGTEEQLIEFGFAIKPKKSYIARNATKMLDEITGAELIISLEDGWLEKNTIFYNSSDDEILEEHIEDLIAKGLVKEVEE